MKQLSNKNLLYLILIVLAIILTSLTNGIDDIFILNRTNAINIILILIGFAITCYTFIYGSIMGVFTKLIEKNIETTQVHEAIKKLLKSLRENIVLIFACVTIIVFCDFANKYNFPFLIDTTVYAITSLKGVILNFIFMLSVVFSVFAFIDIANGMFGIIENSFEILQRADELEVTSNNL